MVKATRIVFFRKFSLNSLNSNPQKLVLFASGSGSNVLNVIAHFAKHPSVLIAAVFCNNPNAGIVEKMKVHAIPLVLFDKKQFQDAEVFLPLLQQYNPSFIALLGFLWRVPNYLVDAYPQHIINLHPALLPKYGGKGMYGMHVHEAVKLAKETETGISIHFVNEHYDEGKLIAQFKTQLTEEDTPQSIAQKIHSLEHKHVPAVIEDLLKA
jgi:phosphoribosylglycinamide formyltransferase-1